mgnify:CR=1 FL=1
MPFSPGFRALVFSALLAAAASSAAQSPPDAAPERSLRDALNALREAGLELVFSDALVIADFRTALPVDPEGDLHEQAVRLLRPFGLGLSRASTGLWYVVRDPAGPPAALAPAEPSPDALPVLETLVVSAPRYRLVRGPRERRGLDHETLHTLPADAEPSDEHESASWWERRWLGPAEEARTPGSSWYFLFCASYSTFSPTMP